MNARQKEIIHLLTINQHGLTASDVAKHLTLIEVMQAVI